MLVGASWSADAGCGKLWRGATLLAAGLLLSGMLPAQTAGYTYLDQPAPYQNSNPPGLTALNLPKLGSTFQVQIPVSWYTWWCCLGSGFYLATGAGNPNVRIPALNGFVFTSGAGIIPSPRILYGTGYTTIDFPIPNDPSLAGAQLYQQVWQYDYAEWVPSTVSLSRGGHGIIGR